MALLFFLVEEQKTPKRIVGRGGESFEVPGGAISVPNWTPLGDPIRQPGGGSQGGPEEPRSPREAPSEPQRPQYTNGGLRAPPWLPPKFHFYIGGGAF